jgi:hypothetical protein
VAEGRQKRLCSSVLSSASYKEIVELTREPRRVLGDLNISLSGHTLTAASLPVAAIEPADLIAMAAQRFGQEDDITVLTLELQPIPTLA